ncbi:ArsR/SmtB family transcription factor [Nitriliruptor alkaliphilus]|uniref:ArsR/SmtB family transcription factor n=1 Tax=Nitriliruptor alkaliphilus TaxID=427918 RepID=UPI001B80E43C|nr:metalloregulator ArsR/SmtB family transcription factor [Nitriliruptor alkaliphilus]
MITTTSTEPQTGGDGAAVTGASTDQEVAVARATAIFRALANPLRVAIVRELARGPRDVTALVDALGVAQPRVSEHLALLRTVNLVDGVRQGRHVVYELVDEHVAHIVEDAVVHAAEEPPAR